MKDDSIAQLSDQVMALIARICICTKPTQKDYAWHLRQYYLVLKLHIQYHYRISVDIVVSRSLTTHHIHHIAIFHLKWSTTIEPLL
jgi:hypothetical protein